MKSLILTLLALGMIQVQTATLQSTHDNVAVFETSDGNLYEVYVDEAPAAGDYSLIFMGDAVVQFVQK